MKNNNEGFSMIEMIVSVLITSIVMLGVISFMTISRVTYMKVSTGTKLNEESMAAANCLNDALVDSVYMGKGGSTTSGDKWFLVKSLADAGSTNKYDLFVFYFKKDDGRLYMKRYCDDTEIDAYLDTVSFVPNKNEISVMGAVPSSKYDVIAEKLTDIDMEYNKSVVAVTLKLEYLEADYENNLKIYTRNKYLTSIR